jgi:hypothetical protein
MYDSWVQDSFTKWNCLTLYDYDKILFVDADKIVLDNMDKLFKLKAPAGTFSSPWAEPYVSRKESLRKGYGGKLNRHGTYGLVNPYKDCRHGAVIAPAKINQGFKDNCFVVIGTVVLLKPSRRMFQFYTSMCRGRARNGGFGWRTCNSMMDEQSLTRCYFESEIAWRYIHQQYNCVPWKQPWMQGRAPYVFHYFNTKPWNEKRDGWPDYEAWWEMATAMLAHSAYSAQERAFMRPVFDAKELAFRQAPLCCFCKETGRPEPDWKQHNLFTPSGELFCPVLRALLAKEQQQEAKEEAKQKKL